MDQDKGWLQIACYLDWSSFAFNLRDVVECSNQNIYILAVVFGREKIIYFAVNIEIIKHR